MKAKIAIFFFVLLGVSTHGQNNTKDRSAARNTVFVEALGNGFLGSLNYERQFGKKPNFTTRVGIGFYPDIDFYLTVPVSVHYLIDVGQNNFIETGIGYTWAQYGADDCFLCEGGDNTDDYNNLFLSIGYRKHFGNNWMWKINFSPLITNNHNANFTPWFGAALGKRF